MQRGIGEVQVSNVTVFPAQRAALTEAPAAFGCRLADWQGASAERWHKRLSIPSSVNFMAVLDGKPAGMVRGVPADDRTPALSPCG